MPWNVSRDAPSTSGWARVPGRPRIRAPKVETQKLKDVWVKPRIAPRRLPGSTEEQDVAVRIANLEPAKTVVRIFERHAEGCSTVGKSTGKFDGERIGVCGIDEGIPPHEGMTLG